MPAPLVVPTTAGPVQGAADDRVRWWLGVRFAAPPVGDLRWRAPRRPEPWTEPADATSFGAVAPQPPNPIIQHGPGAVQSEDCLTLNVWAPADAGPDAGLPVLVWVHGGAYLLGSSRQPLYDAAQLAAGGVVVVTVNYRIGALGWLDPRALLPGTDVRANCGLLDVLFALEWVRDNVSGFGGDPGQVTLVGESAGGGIVTTLLTVPEARGLFHRAVAQSSPVTAVHSMALAGQLAERFAGELGPDRMLTAPVEDLLKAGSALYSRVPVDLPGRIAFAPTIDDDLVRIAPATALATGQGHPVPLVIGTNRDESSAFRLMKSPLLPVTPPAVRQMFDDIAAGNGDVPMPTMRHVVDSYRANGSRTLGLDVARDVGFRMPAVWAAEGHRQVAPVYLYRFDWSTPMLRALRLGATHGTELPYLFGTFGHAERDVTFVLGGRRTGREVSRSLQGRWLSFVRTGVPGGEPDWPAYGEDRLSLVIGKQDRVEQDLDAGLRATWGESVLAFH